MKKKKEKRILTKKQEKALRLCHHDFSGLIQEEAAKIMGIDRKNISKLLNRVKKVFPLMFPIITKQEAMIYFYYQKMGWKVSEIAECMGLSERMVYFSLQRARKKGMPFSPKKGRLLHPDSDRDEDGKANGWENYGEDNDADDFDIDVGEDIKHKDDYGMNRIKYKF